MHTIHGAKPVDRAKYVLEYKKEGKWLEKYLQPQKTLQAARIQKAAIESEFPEQKLRIVRVETWETRWEVDKLK